MCQCDLFLDARSRVREGESQSCQYVREINSWLVIWGSIPWLVMAVGLETNQVPSIWHFLYPRDGNPYVLAWWPCVVVICILGLYWIFLRGRAEILSRYSRIIRGNISSTFKVKCVYLLCIVAGVAALIFLMALAV